MMYSFSFLIDLRSILLPFFLLDHNRSIRAVKDELFIPLFWYEEYGEINDELENEIKMKLEIGMINASVI